MTERPCVDAASRRKRRPHYQRNHWKGDHDSSRSRTGIARDCLKYFLAHEVRKGGFHVEGQKPIPVHYEGEAVDLGFRPDLIVSGQVIVEIKTVAKLAPIHEAQLLSHLRLADIERGLLINFHAFRLADGIKRLSQTRTRQFLGVPGGLGG